LSVTAAAMGKALVISRAAVALDLAAVWVDVREFEDMIGRADAGSLERAVQLYRDDFLAGFTLRGCPEFEEWQESVSEELRQALARGLQRLVTACIAEGTLDRAAGHARRWLQLDPLHEPAHQAIIRLHGWAGDRSAAMRQYRSLDRVLDRDLAVRPLPETTRLYDDVRAGRLGPPPAPSGARPAGPPAPAGCRPPVCHDGGTPLPFVLAADLLRTALAVRPDLPEVLPAQTAAMAGRLGPALAAAHPDSAAPRLGGP